MKLAFLGAGAMGARMAAKLLDAGHAVTVWNRTPERAAALVKAGATLADTPRAAVQDVDAAISMVRDDAASEAVWLDQHTGALAGMPSAAIGVECSTLSLPYVSHLAATFADKGAAFLDAPLAGSRPQAEAGQLIFFVGGLEQHLAAAQPLFEQMGAAAHHAGPTGSGSMVKLAVNALFGAQVALLAEMIGVAERFSGDARRAVEIISSTPVASPAVKAAAAAMTAGAFAPAFPIDLVVKDFRLIATSAANLGAEAPLSSATGEIYAHAAGSGFAADNITGVVQLYSQDRLS